jgi:error-prone DNA polymerase
VLERFRRPALGATLLYCRGRLQREQGVIHVVAEELRDLSPRLRTLHERGDGDAPPRPSPGHDPHGIVIPSRDFR